MLGINFIWFANRSVSSAAETAGTTVRAAGAVVTTAGTIVRAAGAQAPAVGAFARFLIVEAFAVVERAVRVLPVADDPLALPPAEREQLRILGHREHVRIQKPGRIGHPALRLGGTAAVGGAGAVVRAAGTVVRGAGAGRAVGGIGPATGFVTLTARAQAGAEAVVRGRVAALRLRQVVAITAHIRPANAVRTFRRRRAVVSGAGTVVRSAGAATRGGAGTVSLLNGEDDFLYLFL